MAISAATAPPRSQPEAGGPLVIDRIPWSLLGPEFIESWGRYEPKNPQPEHLELLGPNGSGKTFWEAQVNAEMVRRRNSSIVFVATKAADKQIAAMGWPIVSTWREVQKHEQCIFWPRTSKTGVERREYQAARIQELLDNLWGEDANTIVEFDEFAYVETLSPDLKATLQMYLREGRSHGITVVAGKQRPQGTNRDMHSETRVTVAFKMKDRLDNERLAEILGNKQDYLPVIASLDRAKHEFILRHDLSDTSYISWIDKPVDLKKVAQESRGYRR